MSVESKCVDTIRVLSAEAVEKAKSGHPGMCMSAAPMGYELFADIMRYSHKNPKWDNRDRFILSAGHGSMLLYSLLHMFGYNLPMEEIKNFRQLGSRTPGHPEYGTTDGVETSTGPLGQGLANGVGFAIAEAHLAATFNRPGYPIVDHYTYVLCGDGCLEEGLSYEACSLAGTLKLGKLILVYDNNDITIEGDIHTTFDENIAGRFLAQGWQVLRVPDGNNLGAFRQAVERAKEDTTRPSIIICKTVIGYGSPLAGSADCHGAPIGEKNLQKLKDNLGWTYPPFTVPTEVVEHCKKIADEKCAFEDEWNKLFASYRENFPELANLYERYMGRNYSPDLKKLCNEMEFTKSEATRVAGGNIINRLAEIYPNLMSGSADLSPSTKTGIVGGGNFTAENRLGRNIQFGIREHAMSAICNGIQLHGGLKILCSTFFSFVDYMKGGIRMSGLMNIPVVYVMTHDSIGVGEDGPTHQPMEQLINLRSIPNVKVFRPADGKETLAAYISAFSESYPTVIVESRQNLPQYATSGIEAMKGGYVLQDSKGKPDVMLIASGSEVELCTEAKKTLEGKGIKTRVVSLCCMELFERQPENYRESVLPSSVKARVCVEAGSYYSWQPYCKDYGEMICMKSFGVSAPAKVAFEHFGFTAENVVESALKAIKNAKKNK
ncbi:MAG: transketolase [Clostridia bacterium]|nr:transketolase [Clostridia bacterium]